MIRYRSLGILALAGAFVVFAALPLAAQDAAPTPRSDRLTRLVKLVGKDGNGTISLAEAQAFAAARFDRLDTEHRGYLTLDAYEAPLRRAIERASEARRPALERAPPRAEAAFKALNKPGDGRLTKDEFPRRQPRPLRRRRYRQGWQAHARRATPRARPRVLDRGRQHPQHAASAATSSSPACGGGRGGGSWRTALYRCIRNGVAIPHPALPPRR
jgi:hypothetical protein